MAEEEGGEEEEGVDRHLRPEDQLVRPVPAVAGTDSGDVERV